jgi:plastocyanin
MGGMPPCDLCASMIDPFDTNPNDACPGRDRMDFAALDDCACGSGPGVAACGADCAAWCAGAALDPDCKTCLRSGVNVCVNQFDKCAADTMPANEVNGCTPMTAVDLTGQTSVTIVFGGASPGMAYSPPCIHVKKGTQVVWNGDFTQHPLRAGFVDIPHGTILPNPGNPVTPVDTGMSASFQFPTAGVWGFYCNNHAFMGMSGAVFVD